MMAKDKSQIEDAVSYASQHSLLPKNQLTEALEGYQTSEAI
jgi:hypothetical protein